jgi:hypothetical protein
VLVDEEARRFISLAERLPKLSAAELLELNPQANVCLTDVTTPAREGIF